MICLKFVLICFCFILFVEYGVAAPKPYQEHQPEEKGPAATHLANLKEQGCVFNNPNDPFFCCQNGTCISVLFKKTPETEKILADWALKHSTQTSN